MSEPLYKLADQVAELMDLEDIPDDAMRDTLDGLNMQIDDKVENLSKLIKNIEQDIPAIDAEIKRFQKRKKTSENKSAFFKRYIVDCLTKANLKSAGSATNGASLVSGRDVVDIPDEKAVPDDYMNVTTTIKPDRAKALKALKEGQKLNWAVIKKSAKTVRLK